jgi:hypothetical protein
LSSTLQNLLSKHQDVVDYAKVISKYPWLVEKNQDCIVSPDSDGLLCGLFASHFLGWRVRGFYDTKVMLLEDGYKASDCIFLDTEILRQVSRSIGQHIVLFNRNVLPDNRDNYDDCLSINNIRGYDGIHEFRIKYPFGTVHFLIGVLGTVQNIHIPKSAIAPLLFTDGTWMNLVRYTENSLNWLKYLRANEQGTPLNETFLNKHYSNYELMVAMDEFLRKRDKISVARERGDRVTITIRGGGGSPHNLVGGVQGLYDFGDDARDRAEKFLNLLASLTGWGYRQDYWSWRNWRVSHFSKSDFTSTKTALNTKNFNELMKTKNPLSLAMTSGQNIEYTVETPDKMV